MAALPTLYEHFAGGGIWTGLSVDQPYFTLNDKNFTLYGGSMHYFRVPSDYWRDRLRKIRAAGLNTVTTYVPWNLHEPQPGVYDFGNGGSDMQEFLDIERFLKTAQEEDLFVVMRPGPYICAEWEFGGFPSWLLRDKDIKFRTSDPIYMKHVRRYLNVLLTLLAAFQFMNGGPIIAFQVENEYGSMKKDNFIPDKAYMEQLRGIMLDHNITELLFTSDSPLYFADAGSLPTLFKTANFNDNPEEEFSALSILQPNKPFMATEFYPGWFMHWSEKPYVGNISALNDVYTRILRYPASVNIYMFAGGVSWGFMNGANVNKNQSTFQPDITSYDYDAPITEFGGYTDKYFAVKAMLANHTTLKTRLPELPKEPSLVALPSESVQEFMLYEDIIPQLPHQIPSKDPLSMELLPINNGTGQKFGYIIYRKVLSTLPKQSTIVLKGYLRDTMNIYLNGNLMTHNTDNLDAFGYWRTENSSFVIPIDSDMVNATLDLVMCNMGRNNYGTFPSFYQYKGLVDDVYLNGAVLKDWIIMPVEFNKNWLSNLSGWSPFKEGVMPTGPGLYKTRMFLNETVDTYIDMRDWTKGIVIVNDFVLGRYWTIGPQQQLYLPAPLLRLGENVIIIFEEFLPNKRVKFASDPSNFNNKSI